MIEDKSHTPRLIYYHQRNPLLLEELKVLRKEHLMISNTVQMLNKIFSLQLFATFTIAFIEITFEIYFNTVQWKNGLSINLTKQLHLFSLQILHSNNTFSTKFFAVNATFLTTISSRLSSESYQQSSMLIHAKDIFGFSFLLIQSALCCDPNFVTSIVTHLSTLYMLLLVFMMDMLYINCVCVLKACFKEINDDLANLLITNNKSHSAIWIYHEQRNHLLLMKLNDLKKRHLMVNDIVQKLNIIFSPQLLATIALSFIEVTFELYFNMVEWKNGLYINLAKQIHHTYVLTYITYYFVKIALIAWACETGKNQAIKIRTTVHDVLNNINNEQIKYELHLFSLQIMHCDNIFSAKGLSLNATLVRAMMGTITTYFLILIQFLILSHSCDEKTASNVTQTI
ncbi:PREDICTED: putative gustatory receptor 28a [Atta cephalotes]|uniref:Gustatory receptor n=1 Tax=Atta cephalotes TaxID=12957 RepID=A0A158P1N1_ATTCE|nr:PREDICTED: putative gustatory receptor 28a [Atta cephalotes]